MSIYDQVLAELQPRLGKRTEDFLQRQCVHHLKIEPQQLERAHLDDLAHWIRISSALILPKDKAEALGQKIEALK